MVPAAPEPLVEVSGVGPPPPEAPGRARRDWGGFRAQDPASGEILVLRVARDGLRIERHDALETVAWDDVAAVVLEEVGAGSITVRVACIEFRRGPPLALADVHAPGAESLPPRIGAPPRPLLRVERLRIAVAAVVTASGLAPMTRTHFHRGGRGVPPPELVPLPRRLSPALRLLALPASILALSLVVPAVSLASSTAIHASILIHEAGHGLAMLRTGTEIRSLLVLPGLGAALRTEHPFRSRWIDAVVSLAGPLSGVPLAILAILIYDEPPPEPVQWALLAGVAYNLLNLLPFVPLDGGRVLHALIAGLPRGLRTAAAWVPVAAAFAWVLSQGLSDLTVLELIVLAAAVLFTRLSVRRLELHDWVFDAGLDPDTLRAAVRDVSWAFGGAAREDVDGGAPPAPLSSAQAIVVILAYVAVVAALAVCTAAVAPFLPDVARGLAGGSQ